jgi:uncharacterized SAM-binding protein YcdF (DUF218 family)
MTDAAPGIERGLGGRRPGRRAAALLLLALLFVAGLVWSLGFVWFVDRAREADTAPPPFAVDGIVALTGGALRVETALRLLAEGHARVALLSGIGGGADLPGLARRAGLDPAALAAQVTLGRAATSTSGNAIETAAWARENRVRSLIVVTAFYHMPRALLELGRAMPDARLYPVAVMPPAMQRVTALRLMASEYVKWLVARLGLTPEPPARLSARRTGQHV